MCEEKAWNVQSPKGIFSLRYFFFRPLPVQVSFLFLPSSLFNFFSCPFTFHEVFWAAPRRPPPPITFLVVRPLKSLVSNSRLFRTTFFWHRKEPLVVISRVFWHITTAGRDLYFPVLGSQAPRPSSRKKSNENTVGIHRSLWQNLRSFFYGRGFLECMPSFHRTAVYYIEMYHLSLT